MKIILLLLLTTLFIFQPAQAAQKIVAEGNNGYNALPLIKEADSMTQKPFSVLLQYIAPQHALSHFAGWLAQSRLPWLKNYLISYFLKRHTVDMSVAIVENPYDYPSFNSFFTRKLKPDARPIAAMPNIASPADGYISQIGKIKQDTIFQAKGFDYSLTSLLGGSEKLSAEFRDGNFATIYLSPKDYHRVHIPVTGKLRETIFIPGDLFSVNQKTAAAIPNLFARNERLVCIFDTEIGPMAVILVGAMLVGSIETAWHTDTSMNEIASKSFDGSLEIVQGGEVGFFKMGSTAIVLFAKDKIEWSGDLHENTAVTMGQSIGLLK